MGLPDLFEEEKDLAEQLRSLCNPHPINDEKQSKLHESTRILLNMGIVYEKKTTMTHGMDKKLNFIKAATLLHAARVRCENLVKNETLEKNVTAALREMESLLMQNFPRIVPSLLGVSAKIKHLLKNARSKVKLGEITRLKELENDELQIKMEQKTNEVEAVLKYCTEVYMEMISEVAQECLKICGPRPCEFAMVGMGSLARLEVTLYSDFEHVIILEDGVQDREDYENVLEYFRWFLVSFYIVLIGIGETIIPNVGIETLNDFDSVDESKNWFYDSFTPLGVSFRGMMPHACEFPLGRHGSTISKNHIIELEKPVSQMAVYLAEDVTQRYCVGDDLSESCLVFGSEELFAKFKTLSESTSEFTLYSKVCKNKCHFLMQTEYHTLREIDSMIQFYRLLSLLIGYVSRHQGVIAKSGYDKASRLRFIPGCEDPNSIKWALAVTCEIRLKCYEQNYNGRSNSILDSIGSKCLINCISVIRNLVQYLGVVYSSTEGEQSNTEFGIFMACFDTILRRIDEPGKTMVPRRCRPVRNISEISCHCNLVVVSFNILASKGMHDQNKRFAVLAKAEQTLLSMKLQCGDYNEYFERCFKLSYIYYHQGRYQEAKELTESVLGKFSEEEVSDATWLFRIRCVQISSLQKYIQLDDFMMHCGDGLSDNRNVASKLLLGLSLVEAQCKCGKHEEARQLMKQILKSHASAAVKKISFGDWIVLMRQACDILRDQHWLDDVITIWEIVNDDTGNGKLYFDMWDCTDLLFSAVVSIIHLCCKRDRTNEKMNLMRKVVGICQQQENFSSCYVFALIAIKDMCVLDKFKEFKIPEVCRILREAPQRARDDGAFKTITVEMLELIYTHAISHKNIRPLEICHFVECSCQVTKTFHPFLYPLLSQVNNRQVARHDAGRTNQLNRLWRSLFASRKQQGRTIQCFLAIAHDFICVKMHLRLYSKMRTFCRASPDKTFREGMEKYWAFENGASIKKFWFVACRESRNSYLQRLSLTFLNNAVIWHLALQFWQYRIHFDIRKAQITAGPQDIVNALKERSTSVWKNSELIANNTYEASWRLLRDVSSSGEIRTTSVTDANGDTTHGRVANTSPSRPCTCCCGEFSSKELAGESNSCLIKTPRTENFEIGIVELTYCEGGSTRTWSADIKFWSGFRLLNDDGGKGSLIVRRGKSWKLECMMRDVVAKDGVKNERDGDAPGQNCVYILSGEHEREEYRTATFAKFPDYAPVFPIGLSKMGFYYTGYKDRVKCFSCGASVEEWVLEDDVFLPRWHKDSCLMPRGGDPRNIPSQSVYPVLCKQLDSSQQRPNTSANRPQATNRPQNQQTAEVTSRLQNVNIAGNAPSDPPRVRLADIHEASHERMLRSINLHCEEDRRKTFAKWPSYPAPRLPRDLAKSGLFYLGNSDRTQCFCCGGVLRNWMATDNVDEQHQRHFSTCKLFTQYEMSGNIPLSEEARRRADAEDDQRLRAILRDDNDPLDEPPDPPPQEKQRLAVLYPLNNTVNPEMTSLQQRMNSFEGWPAQTRATVRQIAKAGFFYLGEGDKTKCFYCNGGLQNWDRNDEPWTEHAKWFPGCAFILREKGIDFVKRLFELHPNLNRPTIRHPVSYNVPQDIPPNQGRPSSSVIDLNVIQNMGFSADLIQRVMRRKMDRDGSGYGNVEDLLNDLLHGNEEETNTSSMQEAGEHRQPNLVQVVPTSAAATGHKRNGGSGGGGHSSLEEAKKTRTQSPAESMETSSSSASASREMEESLRIMQESDKCKKCKSNPADVMCIPCGHLSLCSNCSKDIKRCIVCNARVQSVMKVFRA